MSGVCFTALERLQGLPLPLGAVSVVRKSFDARAKHRDFAYVVDVDAPAARAAGASPRFKLGLLERYSHAILRQMKTASAKEHNF